MPTAVTHLPPPVNHVFVDFENIHTIDLTVIGSKAISFILLVRARQTKLDVSLVEKLFEHAVSVQLVRLTSAGRNALDFTLAYYVGRAVAADPTGYFHIISKDVGYDPLIKHLRSRHISANRHESFATLTFANPAKPAASTPPATAPFVGHARAAAPDTARKAKPQPPPKSAPDSLSEQETRMLEHFRSHPATRPRNQKTLVRFLIGHLGHKLTEAEALSLVESLGQAGHLFIDDKGKVTYHLEPR